MLGALSVFALFSQAYAGCKINLDGLTGKYPPLILQNQAFVFPTSRDENDKRTLNFDEGEEVQLFCHGSSKNQETTFISILGLPEEPSLILKCEEAQFYYKTTQVNVEQATCNRRQEPNLERINEECSSVGADGRTEDLQDLWTVKIGWQIEDTFIEQIRVCIDESIYATIWTNHTLYGASIDFRDIDSGRPSFRTDNTGLRRFYTWTTSTGMNRVYSKDSQASTVTKLLGSNVINSQPVIETSTSGTNYFAKGHLAPDAAFVYNVLQDATYYFFNAAPQFQSFNNGNWKALEYNTRDLAMKLGRDISVYTGTHGILEYADKKKINEPMFLYVNSAIKYVPAPLYYWKVLYDASTDTAAAFIGLNNPHAQEPPKELCPNRCAAMDWVDWSVTELDSGYMYCCTVEEARKAIPSMPDIKTAELIQLNPAKKEVCTCQGA